MSPHALSEESVDDAEHLRDLARALGAERRRVARDRDRLADALATEQALNRQLQTSQRQRETLAYNAGMRDARAEADRYRAAVEHAVSVLQRDGVWTKALSDLDEHLQRVLDAPETGDEQ